MEAEQRGRVGPRGARCVSRAGSHIGELLRMIFVRAFRVDSFARGKLETTAPDLD